MGYHITDNKQCAHNVQTTADNAHWHKEGLAADDRPCGPTPRPSRRLGWAPVTPLPKGAHTGQKHTWACDNAGMQAIKHILIWDARARTRHACASWGRRREGGRGGGG
eukprot:2958480-Pyramimonas_sp.AAC.1